VSALRRPHASAERRRLVLVTAAKLRSRVLVRDAHAVCVFNSQYLQSLWQEEKKLTGNDYLGMRPAGKCTCERSVAENKAVTGDSCSCGQRPAGEFSLTLNYIYKHECNEANCLQNHALAKSVKEWMPLFKRGWRQILPLRDKSQPAVFPCFCVST
jgi:hypothetical protein